MNPILFLPNISNPRSDLEVFHPSNIENSLTQLAGFPLLSELESQLKQASKKISEDIKTKQQLQKEIEILKKLQNQIEIPESPEENYPISTYEAQLLELTPTYAIQNQKEDDASHHPIPQKIVENSLKSAITKRENQLVQLNSSGEVDLLKIQSMVEQRKNIFSLISNLLATSHECLKNIINNIK